MNPGRPAEGWNQIMTLPRRLTLLQKMYLGRNAGDFTSLHYNPKHLGPLKLEANKEIVLKEINGSAMEISAEIDMLKSPDCRT